MEKRVSKMKSNAVYNHWDNLVYVRTDGNMIHVICHKEEQMDAVNERFHGTEMSSLDTKNGMRVMIRNGL